MMQRELSDDNTLKKITNKTFKLKLLNNSTFQHNTTSFHPQTHQFSNVMKFRNFKLDQKYETSQSPANGLSHHTHI